MQFDLFRNAKATDAGAALNHASMASTVLEKIAASSVQRAAALPAVTRAEFDAAELERRQHLPLSALMAMRSRSDMVFFRLPCAFQAAE